MVAIHSWKNTGDTKERYFIAIPTPDGLHGLSALSLAKAAAELTEDGYNLELVLELGNCHVDDARNVLVNHFMRSDCTHLIFIDSDIVYEPDGLRELIDAPGDIVGSSYPYKDESGTFPGTFNQVAFADEETGLVPIDGLPTGFLKVSRTAFDAIAPTVPTFYSKNDPSAETHEFFARTIVNGIRVGGDIAFCDKAKAAGIQCWLAPKIVLGHTGFKTWTGSWYWKQSVLSKGYYPSLREAYLDGKWENQQVMGEIEEHWGNGMFQAGAHYTQAAMHLAQEFCKDKPILEMGSGLSTLFLSLKAQELDTKLVSLEEDRMWYGKVWGALKDLGTEAASVEHTPTVDCEYDVPKDYYDRKWGLVCVDGPCGTNNKNGRKQSLKFDADCYLFDDANRPQIIETIKEIEGRGYNSKIVSAEQGRLIVVCVRK